MAPGAVHAHVKCAAWECRGEGMPRRATAVEHCAHAWPRGLVAELEGDCIAGNSLSLTRLCGGRSAACRRDAKQSLRGGGGGRCPDSASERAGMRSSVNRLSAAISMGRTDVSWLRTQFGSSAIWRVTLTDGRSFTHSHCRLG